MSAIDRSGWRTVRLGDIAEVVTGTTPSTTEPRYWGGHVPFVTPSDLTGHVFTGQTARTLSDDGAAVARVVPAHSTLVTCIGTVGRVALTTVPCTTNQQINAVIPGPEVDATFLSYALATQARVIERLAGVTAVPIVNKSQLKDLRLRIPNLDHQVRIAQLLQRASEVLQQVDSLIAAKREFKRGLMQELLTGRRRFPEFASEPWIEAPLGELFSERSETGFEHLPLLAVTGDRGVVLRDELDRRDTSSKDKSKYKRVCPGDIAYNTMRMWQGVSGLSQYEGIVSPAYTVVTPTGPMMGRYARHLFKLPRIVHSFWRHSQGLVDDTLSLKFPRFAIIQVTFPSRLDEQQRIASVLDAIDREIEVLIHIRTAYDNQKRGLMQKLLTGELAIPVSSEPEPVHA